MPTQRYSVSQSPVETLLAWIKSGDIAIPESIRGMTVEEYPEFLGQRRMLMAQKIKEYFRSL